MTDPKKSTIPVADDLDGGSFGLQGTVVYAKNPLEKDTDGLSGMGIQFKAQSDDASKTLKEYIETIIAEGTRIG